MEKNIKIGSLNFTRVDEHVWSDHVYKCDENSSIVDPSFFYIFPARNADHEYDENPVIVNHDLAMYYYKAIPRTPSRFLTEKSGAEIDKAVEEYSIAKAKIYVSENLFSDGNYFYIPLHNLYAEIKLPV